MKQFHSGRLTGMRLSGHGYSPFAVFGKRTSDESDKMVLNIQEPIFVFCPEVGFECMLDNYYHITLSNHEYICWFYKSKLWYRASLRCVLILNPVLELLHGYVLEIYEQLWCYKINFSLLYQQNTFTSPCTKSLFIWKRT